MNNLNFEENFISRLNSTRQCVWNELKKYLPQKYPQFHYRMVREYPLRKGKYFRPCMVILGAELFGGRENAALLTAVAMQLSEEWLLVHDDFEDHSETRRRTARKLNPTLNVLYGDELAVNAGDALHILMWRALGDAMRKLGDERAWRVFDKMNDILLTTTEGQSIELSWIKKNKINISEKEYYNLINRKAGYYTVSGPLQLGAIVANARPQNVRAILEWGVPFGSAFQIRDDVLNIIGGDVVIGKERGGDIAEGKRTLLLIHLLKSCTRQEKKYVEGVYRKRRCDKSSQEISTIIGLMEHYGSIDYANRKAFYFAESAEKYLDRLRGNFSRDARDCLKGAVRFVVTRFR